MNTGTDYCFIDGTVRFKCPLWTATNFSLNAACDTTTTNRINCPGYPAGGYVDVILTCNACD